MGCREVLQTASVGLRGIERGSSFRDFAEPIQSFSWSSDAPKRLNTRAMLSWSRISITLNFHARIARLEISICGKGGRLWEGRGREGRRKGVQG